ncbi:hypothetical protein VZT92_027979 [Zoarces viviparus]|uniref:Uncharacterized protein n=1 Tax=Zoarces viviparus TaxID=48416 RepID=A0AAW1DW77_ZOAVI
MPARHRDQSYNYRNSPVRRRRRRDYDDRRDQAPGPRRDAAQPVRGARAPNAGSASQRDGRSQRDPPRRNREERQGHRRPRDHSTRRPRTREGHDNTYGEERRDGGRRPARQRSRSRARRNDSGPRSDDPDFALKCRILFKVIKTLHHFLNVTENKPPLTIDRMTKHLTATIKPAVPNPHVLKAIEGNAKTWAKSTLKTLKEHYEETAQVELESLSKLRVKEWGAPFQIASNWAQRSFGKRLAKDTLESAEQVITDTLKRLTAEKEEEEEEVEDGDTSSITELETGDDESTTSDNPPESTTQGAEAPHGAELDELSTPDWSPALMMGDNVLPPPSQKVEHRPNATEETPLNLQYLSPRPRRIHERTTGRQSTTDVFSLVPRRARQPGPKATSPTTQRPDSPQAQSLASFLEEPFLDWPSPTEEQVLRYANRTNNNTDPGLNTTREVDSLHTAVQTRLDLTQEDFITPQRSTLCHPNRHLSSNRKATDWSLNIKERCIIMGDSNISRFPSYDIAGLQVDGFPGANLRHAEEILAGATSTTPVEKIVLAFGLNNRVQKSKDTAVKQLQRTLRMCRTKFPLAQVLIPQINFSPGLPRQERTRLTYLNTHIAALKDHIPLWPEESFQTGHNHLHWSPETAKGIFKHWCIHLNLN